MKKSLIVGLFSCSIFLASCITIAVPSSQPSSATEQKTTTPQASTTPNTSTPTTGVTPTTPVVANLMNPADPKEKEFMVACVDAATKSAPTIANASIQNYCACSMNSIKAGKTTENDIKSCAVQAGIPVNNNATANKPAEEDPWKDTCKNGGATYEDQLVCSGIPAAALPRVPY